VVAEQDKTTNKCALVECIFSLDQIFKIQNLLFRGRMTIGTKIDEKLEGADNFRARRYRVSLLLEERDLEKFTKEEVSKPEGDEAKAKHKKDMVKAKRIIADSIKDHLNHHISSLSTPKEMMDALT
jgi:hypothetical protein